MPKKRGVNLEKQPAPYFDSDEEDYVRSRNGPLLPRQHSQSQPEQVDNHRRQQAARLDRRQPVGLGISNVSQPREAPYRPQETINYNPRPPRSHSDGQSHHGIAAGVPGRLLPSARRPQEVFVPSYSTPGYPALGGSHRLPSSNQAFVPSQRVQPPHHQQSFATRPHQYNPHYYPQHSELSHQPRQPQQQVTPVHATPVLQHPRPRLPFDPRLGVQDLENGQPEYLDR